MAEVLKYFNGDDPQGKYPVRWIAGEEGMPSDPPLRHFNSAFLTRDQLDRVVRTYDFQSRMFDLAIPADHADYTRIMDQVVNGLASFTYIERQYDKEQKQMRIYLEWVYIYSEISDVSTRPRPPAVSDFASLVH